ncbi:hypothetical protein E4665_01535 [Sporolactobacillus shoreae]|uniref:Uncharacterized protein n=1 Tax=Sporolactobacillus shoreae TaxID=1465501 RepID=A0A4Z0GVR7_9BACL|nr:hypothetical protein [Sporolactobacillus shoreae]TGB00386.1 hypothetical protein E4665_01535 [Sporolactobacillus shoreae]
MGLNFSHCDAHWSYGLFHDFREKLAREIGMDLNRMEGFGGNTRFSDFDDAIIPLLNHSDCEGEMTAKECSQVAPRLRELVADWSEEDYVEEALSLAGGMELAARNDQPLIFC